jgi:hypothetical protein
MACAVVGGGTWRIDTAAYLDGHSGVRCQGRHEILPYQKASHFLVECAFLLGLGGEQFSAGS